MQQFDVVVIGSGLAGLQCARQLVRGGARVMLVDRKRSVDQAVHTTGIFVRKTFTDFDLPPDLLGPPVRQIHLYTPSLRSWSAESKHDEFRVGNMGAIYRRLHEDCRRLGASLALSTAFVESQPSPEGTIVTLRTGSLTWRIRTRLLVGADGVHSKVARDLALERNTEWIVGVEQVLTGARLDGPPAFHCFLNPVLAPGYLGWLVNDGEQIHLGVGGFADRFQPASALALFRNKLESLFDLSTATLMHRRGGKIPVGGVLKNIGCRRGLLVGDAAGAVSPLTAGGLDGAMRLSAFAATTILRFLETGDPSILDGYSGRPFRSRFISRIWMRRLFSSVTAPMFFEAGVALLQLTPLSLLARHLFFGRGSFPEPRSSSFLSPSDSRVRR